MSERLANMKKVPQDEPTMWLIGQVERLEAEATQDRIVFEAMSHKDATIRADERERAAKMADVLAAEVDDGYSDRGMTLRGLAAAIRAEKKK